MAALVASTCPLSADLAITERSRRLYDGSYKWDSDGFTDEHGVYREYDCLDPLARAPTPPPPMLLYDDEDDDSRTDVSNTETTNSQDISLAVTPTGRAIPEPATPLSTLETSHSTAPLLDAPRTPGSIRRFAVNLLNRPKQGKAAHQESLEVMSQVEQGSPGASEGAEGAEPGSKPREMIDVLRRSQEHCGGPKPPPNRESSSMKMPDAPPASPKKMLSVIQNVSPASITSKSSPVPSNLLDHDEGEGLNIKGASAAKSVPNLPATPTKSKCTTTRGVARKITKASKKAYANKFSPLGRK